MSSTTDHTFSEEFDLARWWNRSRYQLYAPIYDWVARPLEAGRKRAITLLDPDPGDRILILGCGTGSDLKYLPPETSITALDAAPAMAQRTATRAEELDLEVHTLVGDAQAVPSDDDTFDAVLLHLVLSVVPNPGAVAAETDRVLRPDGRVSIFDKFVPEGTSPSLLRRILNPGARLLFSDLTRQLAPLLSGTRLEIQHREKALRGLYTIALARPSSEEPSMPEK